MVKKVCLYLLSICCLVALHLPATAQHEKEVKALETEAHKAFAIDEYSDALPMYLMLDSIKKEEALVKARIGICYLFSPAKYKAFEYLLKAKDLNYTKDGINYYLGKAYHLRHEFDKAIEYYSIYRSNIHHGLLKHKDKFKEIDDLIAQCKVGKKLVEAPVEATIENLGPKINSSYSDFAPVITADENTLIFTSKRPNNGRRDEYGNYYEDIYISNKVNGSWETPKNIGSPVNTKVNDASIGLSLDGEQLFVYKNDTSELDYSGGDVFESILKDGKWSKPKRLSKNINSDHWEPSSSIIADENVLFFSSDRPGGYGGTDLYVSRRTKNNTWGPAHNLGAKINSPYDEDAPFIHPDSKTLYFSSNGPMSMGGFDIFTATYDRTNDSVGYPENIGYPVNTSDDELFFVWSADGKRGYFSACREDNFGDEDIYVVNRPNIKIDLVLLNGKIHANEKSVPAKIKLYDNLTNELVATYDSTKFHENYTILLEPGKNYTVSIECDKYLSHSENIVAPLNGFVKIEKDIEMKPLDKGGAVALNNVFFEKESNVPRKESLHELDRYYGLLKGKKDLVIEIANHTYDYGTDHAANLALSQRRADAIADYIVKKGMDKNRVKAFGYGDKFNLIKGDSVHNTSLNTRTDFIIVHNLKDGALPEKYDGFYNKKENLKSLPEPLPAPVRNKHEMKTEILASTGSEIIYPAKATEEEKKKIINNYLKKRVKEGKAGQVLIEGNVSDLSTSLPLNAEIELLDQERKIIARTKSSNGKFSFETYQSEEKPCTLSVRKNKYSFLTELVVLPANGPDKVAISKQLFLKPLLEGTKFALRNIYYDNNRASLRSESMVELHNLETLLKSNKKMMIEIAGFTDSKGADSYNKMLSQQRAESVLKYLEIHGIEKSRIQAVGYGEEKPLATNDDEEEGRELNRRTEIHILKK